MSDPLSFWYDRLSFRYDMMTDISRWYIHSRFEMRRWLSFRQGLDFSPSVNFQKDNHISCHIRMREWRPHHIERTVIGKVSVIFCSRKREIISIWQLPQKTLETLSYQKESHFYRIVLRIILKTNFIEFKGIKAIYSIFGLLPVVNILL